MEIPSKTAKSGKSMGGGVKWYQENIIEMVKQIKSEKFLKQIQIIIKRHIEKGGD